MPDEAASEPSRQQSDRKRHQAQFFAWIRRRSQGTLSQTCAAILYWRHWLWHESIVHGGRVNITGLFRQIDRGSAHRTNHRRTACVAADSLVDVCARFMRRPSRRRVVVCESIGEARPFPAANNGRCDTRARRATCLDTLISSG